MTELKNLVEILNNRLDQAEEKNENWKAIWNQTAREAKKKRMKKPMWIMQYH